MSHWNSICNAHSLAFLRVPIVHYQEGGLPQSPENPHHVDRRLRRVITLVVAAGNRSRHRLLICIHCQHSKRHGNACVQTHLSNPGARHVTDVLEVSSLSSYHASYCYNRVEAL